MERLFAKQFISTVIDYQRKQMKDKIEALTAAQLLRDDWEDLCARFESEFTLDVPTLNEAGIEVETSECRIRSRDGESAVRPRFAFITPFQGDPALFLFKPSTCSLNMPDAEFQGNSLVLTYVAYEERPEIVKTQFHADLKNINLHLDRLRTDVESFNSSLRADAKSHILTRREKLLQVKSAAESMGYPVRK